MTRFVVAMMALGLKGAGMAVIVFGLIWLGVSCSVVNLG